MFGHQDSYDVNGSISKKTSRNDLKIAVAYHSLSADTQNEIDKTLNENFEDSTAKNNTANQNEIVKGFYEKTDTDNFETIALNESNTSIHKCVCNTIKIKPNFEKKDFCERDLKVEKSKRPEIMINDHLISMEEFLAKYQTNTSSGLTKQQVETQRVKDGINALSKKRKQFIIIKYVQELVCGYNFIMWTCAILCLLCYQPLGGNEPDVNNLILSCLLFAAIFFQGTFSFFQHRRSDNLMASFEKLMPHIATVLRDNHWQTVNTWELVVGDVLRSAAGDKIPADIRVVECSQASVEKSSLTGESEAVKLSVNSTDSNPYETKNLAMFGTSIIEGTVTGVVFQTGDRTVMGKIAEITMNTKTKVSTMQREINYFASIIGTMSILTGLLTFILWYFWVKLSYPDFLTYTGTIIACIGVVVSFFRKYFNYY